MSHNGNCEDRKICYTFEVEPMSSERDFFDADFIVINEAEKKFPVQKRLVEIERITSLKGRRGRRVIDPQPRMAYE